MHSRQKLVRSALLASALMFGALPAFGAATEFVVPSGPLITLQNGRTIDGHIIRIDQTNIVIQTKDGASEILPRSTVRTVAFKTVTGQELTGELVGWEPGVYQIATAEAALNIYSTMPATASSNETRVAVDIREEEAAPAGGPATEDAGQDNSQAIAAASLDGSAGELNEGAPDAAVGSEQAALPATANLSIKVSVENSKENGPPVAFNIALSEPSDSSVVLIYATIDGTAINGEDYEANRGVVVIKPGEQSARIEAPIIDDSEKEEQEHLQLFLTVDPTVAVVENRQIIATIDDDDQG
ncbi:MAG: Calx-beta domain-containing protein [Pseudomonadota bacterium]